LVDEVDPNERLSPDDQATQRDAEFLQRALLIQADSARRRPASQPGVCTNCGGQCFWPAVYCDDDCREDHEHRLQLLATVGRGL
jgi:hypothetical protein